MKSKFMQTAIGTLLGLLLLVGCAQLLVSAQNSSIFESAQSDDIRQPDIVGVFRTIVTQRNCQTGNPIGTFQGLLTFNKGGTMAETSTALPPALRTPGHGVWQRKDHLRQDSNDLSQQYSIAFTFLRFNPDGTFFGTQVIRQTVTLESGGNQLNTTNFIEAYNASGNLLGTGCATSVGTRFE